MGWNYQLVMIMMLEVLVGAGFSTWSPVGQVSPFWDFQRAVSQQITTVMSIEDIYIYIHVRILYIYRKYIYNIIADTLTYVLWLYIYISSIKIPKLCLVMSKSAIGRSFSLLNDQQMGNNRRVERQADAPPKIKMSPEKGTMLKGNETSSNHQFSGDMPIRSTYGIFTYIYHKNQVNVGTYTLGFHHH